MKIYLAGRVSKNDWRHDVVRGLRGANELDGMVGHSKPEDIEKDRRRQREIEALGWRFIRFGGREVVRDVDKCVAETAAMLGQPR